MLFGAGQRTAKRAGSPRPLSSVVTLRRSAVGVGVMLGQDVLAPIARERPPHRVNVVGVVLGVVVLHDKRGALDRVVVAGALLDRAAPGESDPVQPGPLDLVPLLTGHLVA